jgi:hypothetical protein
MGDPQKLSIRIIGNINAACALIGDNEALDGTVAYRIGRLADASESIVVPARRQQDKKLAAFREKILKMSDQEKAIENDKLKEELNKITETEEEINVPELNYSDFVAKSDMTIGSGATARTYNKGSLLVPVKFFSLMGALIIDDRKLIKEATKKTIAQRIKKHP